jgi:hypothetical protein
MTTQHMHALVQINTSELRFGQTQTAPGAPKTDLIIYWDKRRREEEGSLDHTLQGTGMAIVDRVGLLAVV